MWDQYKKTFRGMQAMILLVCVCLYLATQVVAVAAVFFVAMQVSAVLGAVWAYRLRRKIDAAPFNATAVTGLKRR